MERVSTQALQLPRLAVSTRERALGISGLVLGLVMIFVLGVKSKAGEHAHFVLAPSGASVHVPTVSVSARWTCWVLGVIVLALSGWLIAGRPSRRQRVAIISVVVALFLIAFLAWASATSDNSQLSIVQLGNQTLVRSVPIILGALCGVLCERSGVINIAIEGQFLLGAFTGTIVAAGLSSLWLGLFGAALAGGLLGLVLAFLAIRYFVDQVILGVVLNVFALGLTNFLYDRILITHQNLNSPKIFDDIKVPGLADIPIIGPIFFDANVFLYITYGLLIVMHVALFRTRWGLRLRAVGEHPTAADTVGIKVRATRYRAVVLGGLIAGIAGASFTIGSVGGFGKDISSGKGYIALAALIFGRWSPAGALGAALIFGFADALQSNLGVVGTPIPSEFLGMLPYLATVLAVAGLVGKVRAPGADGKPYAKS
jgi:simple sugar transport system permease protein